MDNATPVPTSLKVVAFVFILEGIFSLIEVIVSLMHNHLSINLGVLKSAVTGESHRSLSILRNRQAPSLARQVPSP